MEDEGREHRGEGKIGLEFKAMNSPAKVETLQ